MRPQVVGLAQRSPQRQPFHPAVRSRRGEAAAALATCAVVLQLAAAQATLIVALVLTFTGRISRWRPQWLGIPAAAGFVWLLADGLRPAFAGFASEPRQLVGALSAPGGLTHLAATFSDAAHWLPAQLPLALIAGSAEAAILLRIGRQRGSGSASPQWRPGLIACVRRRLAANAMAAGHTATAHGCAVGIDAAGQRAMLSWAQAERGVLISGTTTAAVIEAALPVACAALRRRKAVVVVDVAGAETCDLVAALATSLAVRATVLEAFGLAQPGQPAAALGDAIRRRDVLLISALTAPARALADLASLLSSMRDLQLRGDCLAWIHGCERGHADVIGKLIALGSDTGTSVLLSTQDSAAASTLARLAEVAIVAQSTGSITMVSSSCAGVRFNGVPFRVAEQ